MIDRNGNTTASYTYGNPGGDLPGGVVTAVTIRSPARGGGQLFRPRPQL